VGRLGQLRRLTLGALIAATIVAAIALYLGVVRDLVPYEAAVDIPWWALAVGFAIAEVFVIHAHVRGSAHSLSLSEVPLVLGLLLADPSDLVLAMVVGPAVVLAFTRGHGVVRLFFNLGQFALTGEDVTAFTDRSDDINGGTHAGTRGHGNDAMERSVQRRPHQLRHPRIEHRKPATARILLGINDRRY